jgi:hypothetical protein
VPILNVEIVGEAEAGGGGSPAQRIADADGREAFGGALVDEEAGGTG